MLTLSTAPLTATFTFAPSFDMSAPKHNLAMAVQVDRIQGAFNMSLFGTADRVALLTISDSLYDLFCAYEQDQPEAYEMAEALIAAMKAHPSRYTAGMMDAITGLEDAINGEIEF